MLLRLLAFVFFVLALATLGGDIWHAQTPGQSFSLRSLGEWWTQVSPGTLTTVQGAVPAIAGVLVYPALTVLGLLGFLSLLPAILMGRRR